MYAAKQVAPNKDHNNTYSCPIRIIRRKNATIPIIWGFSWLSRTPDVVFVLCNGLITTRSFRCPRNFCSATLTSSVSRNNLVYASRCSGVGDLNFASWAENEDNAQSTRDQKLGNGETVRNHLTVLLYLFEDPTK
jgi:hypothetical protein